MSAGHHSKHVSAPPDRTDRQNRQEQEEEEEEEEEEAMDPDDPSPSLLHKQVSSISLCTDSDDDDEELDCQPAAEAPQDFVPSPLLPLKKQLELDKEDESLRRWKEKLLGSVHLDSNEEKVEPEVEVVGLAILAKGRKDLVIPLPFPANKSEVSFRLKEGSNYKLKFSFTVRHNLVSGLTYLNTVWRAGLQVDKIRVMLGSFSPQQEPYTYVMDEETTPAGILARGVYTAKTKFIDDDGRCYLEADYSFEIKKDW